MLNLFEVNSDLVMKVCDCVIYSQKAIATVNGSWTNCLFQLCGESVSQSLTIVTENHHTKLHIGTNSICAMSPNEERDVHVPCHDGEHL